MLSQLDKEVLNEVDRKISAIFSSLLHSRSLINYFPQEKKHMCQGIILVLENSTKSFHWGVGSHSSLIEKTYKNSDPKVYDKLIRVESDLYSGPGYFTIEGGRVDEDLTLVIRDKYLDLAGTPEKVVSYLGKKLEEGFKWDESFLALLSDKGLNVYNTELAKYTDTGYESRLTHGLKKVNATIKDLSAGRHYYSPGDQFCRTRAAIALVALGLETEVLEGPAADAAIDRHSKSVNPVDIPAIRKHILTEVEKVLLNTKDEYFNNSDCFHRDSTLCGSISLVVRNMKRDTFRLKDTPTAEWFGRDAFDALSDEVKAKAVKIQEAYVQKLWALLPTKPAQTKCPQLAALTVAIQDDANLSRQWNKAGVEAAHKKWMLAAKPKMVSGPSV